jgi:mannose-6-phosphate isomerase-like protein (cupin superfamily)
MTGTVVRHHAGDRFKSGLRASFAYRDLGIRDASEGRVGAHVIRAVPGIPVSGEWHLHEVDFQMLYVLRGWVEFEFEDIGVVRLDAGSSVFQPPRVRHREIRHSDDLEVLEVTAPASFETRMVEAPVRGEALPAAP